MSAAVGSPLAMAPMRIPGMAPSTSSASGAAVRDRGDHVVGVGRGRPDEEPVACGGELPAGSAALHVGDQRGLFGDRADARR